MSKQTDSVSFQIVSDSQTGWGIPFGEPLEHTTPQFRIHECGFLSSLNYWESGAIMSPFWCLWYQLGDGSWIESDNQRWDLGPDSLVLAPSNVVYSTHSCRPSPQLWLHFTLLPAYAFEASTPYKIPLDTLLRQQLAALMSEYDAISDPRILFHHSMALLNNCFARHPLPLRILPDALRTLLHRIESTPADDLSNAHLARSVGMSTGRFILWFESHMNQSPAAYVRRVRYQKAGRKLVSSEASIEQIASELGYPNRHYFSRVFAQYAGCGPATFRKQYHDKMKKQETGNRLGAR